MALDELLEEFGAASSVDASSSLVAEDVFATVGCVDHATGVGDAVDCLAILGRFPVLVAVYSTTLEVTLYVFSELIHQSNFPNVPK